MAVPNLCLGVQGEMYLPALILFHLLFFRRFYFINPYCYATSEPMELEFPYWKGDGKDYWVYPECLPILATFYPPFIISRWLGKSLNIDHAWILFQLTNVLHYLWASIGGYLLFRHLGYGEYVSFFGAITLTHMAYSIKQCNSIIYTLAWAPWLLLGAVSHNFTLWLGSASMGILGGYWPLWAYSVPLSLAVWLFSR